MRSLKATEAADRAGLLDVRRYDVELDLTDLLDGTTLRSRSTVSFVARRPGEATFVDVVADSVEAWLDGVPLAGSAFDGERLWLPPLDGEHRLEVASVVTRTGERAGIHRTVDADGEVYVWTNFEPDDARRVYACFDQPDLKAAVAFTVHAPVAWTVVSNSAVRSRTEGTWVFEDTPRLSPYVTVVCAGPFHQIRRTVDGYDLGLLARRSLASQLDAQAGELFDLTARGLRFFGERFASPFAQRTYTQVFCPDFGGAAMENWGCVTWTDQFLYRSEPTAAEANSRAVILLHEMAHMWFGDLVTLRWWDDLWLNEAFADWAALEAAEQATGYTGAWRWYLGSRKEDGYTQDAGPSTHPVYQEIPTAADAKAAFDGLTYGKGAALLRQMAAYVGEADFWAGLRRYFADHAYGNATLTDLLTAVGGDDLREWADNWLLTAGTDVITVRPATDAVEIRVTPPANLPARRIHRLTVGFYDLRADRPVLRRRVPVQVSPPVTTVPGEPAADLVLVNDDDKTFARVRPDDASLKFLLRHGFRLPDPASRGLIRILLWHLLEDGLLPPAELTGYAADALPVETDAIVRDDLLRTAVTTAVDWAGEPDDRLFAACVALASDVPPARTAALRAALDVARTTDQLNTVDGLIGDSFDLRWRWLMRAAAAGRHDPAAVERLLASDPDPDARWSALAVRAARPDAAAKEEAWQAIFTERRVPPSTFGMVGRAFWQPGQESVLGAYPDRYVEELPRLAGAHLTIIVAVLRHLFPRHGVDAGFPDRAMAAADRPEMSPSAAARLRAQADVLARMLRARSLTAR